MLRLNLQHLRDRLAHLNSQIPLLEAERTTIHKTLSAVFYSVLDLPSEVTSEIFLHCLPDAPSVPSSITAPLLLLKICRRWRDIALKTPALWASFAVYGGSGRTFGSMGTDHCQNGFSEQALLSSISVSSIRVLSFFFRLCIPSTTSQPLAIQAMVRHRFRTRSSRFSTMHRNGAVYILLSRSAVLSIPGRKRLCEGMSLLSRNSLWTRTSKVKQRTGATSQILGP
jgi:hypothetical protein